LTKKKLRKEENEPWKTLNEWAELFDVLENGF